MSDRLEFGAGMDSDGECREESLKSSLDRWTQPKAREAFRAQLRERFLSGTAESSGAERGLSQAEESTAFGAGVWGSRGGAAEDAILDVNRRPAVTNDDAVSNTTHVSNNVKQFKFVLDAWVPEAPKPAFREQIRERFLSSASAGSAPSSQVRSSASEPQASDSEITERSDSESLLDQPARPQERGRAANLRPVASARADQRRGNRSTPSRRAPVSARSQRRRTWSIVGGAVALAAAAVVAMVWVPSGTGGTGGSAGLGTSGWSFLAGGQVAQVDGQAAQASGGGPLALAGSPKVVTAGDQILRIQYLDEMVVELEPGSSLDISDLTEEGHADDGWVLTMSGDKGGYRVATMEDFRLKERSLRFRTPDAEVQVVGTVFGIDRYTGEGDEPKGTCVCCCDGEVQVTSRSDGRSDAVVAGASNYVYSDSGSLNPMANMPGPHAKPLEVLAEAYHNK